MIFKIKHGESTIELSAENDTLISSLKLNVEQSTGIQAARQRWIYQGRVLSNTVTVAEAGIIEGNTVHVMKISESAANPAPRSQDTSGSNNAGLSAANLAYSTNIVPANPVINTQKISLFDTSIKTLLLNSEDDAKNAISTLLKIVANIIDKPLEEKYRRLKNSNVTFQKRILSLRGGPECFKALGFTLEGEEWVLHPSAEAWELILMYRQKLEKFSKLMNQSTAVSAASGAPSAADPPLLPSISSTSAASEVSASASVSHLDPHTSSAMQDFMKALLLLQQQQQQQQR